MENTCCGLCDLDVCHNKDCERWKKLEHEQEMKEAYEDYWWTHTFLND